MATLASQAAAGVTALGTLAERLVRDADVARPQLERLVQEAGEAAALGAAHAALASRTAALFAAAAAEPLAGNHMAIDGAAAAAAVAEAVRFVLPVFQALLAALAADA